MSMSMLRSLVVLVASLATSVAGTAQMKLFDNFNTNACGYTDSATFTLQASAHIGKIQVWYHWRSHESSVRYTIFRNKQAVGDGVLARGECDPYQDAWCLADDSTGMNLDRGDYTIQTERPRVCQNDGSSGVGFVKVFGHFTRIHE